jgi:sugar phosphate isomerase/epimerase
MLKLLKRVLPVVVIPVLLLLGAAGPPAKSPLLVYDFNLAMGPVGNVNHVDALGFDGIVTRLGVSADLVKLEEYARHTNTIADFDLLAFVAYDFTNPDSPQVWRDALPILAKVGAPLWVIVRNAPSDADLRQLLVRMGNDSAAVGVETVIYPHWNTDIESAAEATALIRELGHPNLKNSLHTCHEIRSGNQYTLDKVASKHSGVSALVTIAGAEANAYAGPFTPFVDWSDAIMPLDSGAFSLLPFLQELHDSGYDGPVILQTFGITGDPGHLERSLRKYAEYMGQITP